MIDGPEGSAMLADLAARAPIGVAAFAKDGTCWFANEAAQRLARRVEPPGPVGAAIADLFPWLGAPPFVTALESARAACPAVDVLAEHAATARWYEATIYAAGPGVGAIFRDVTARELGARHRSRDAVLRERLLGIVGHDLRGPLTAIVMSASVMLRDPELAASQKVVVARIARGADRMQRMIHQLLEFTRFRLGGGVNLETTRVDLDELVREVVDEARTGSGGAPIVIDGCGAVWGSWDRVRVGEVIANLLANALEHRARGSTVTVRVRSEPGRALLSVHNDGEPIPPALARVIFDPFGRASEPRRRSHSLGLGLYISRGFVTSHGGSIDVRSSREDGTTFEVRLPRGDARAPDDDSPDQSG